MSSCAATLLTLPNAARHPLAAALLPTAAHFLPMAVVSQTARPSLARIEAAPGHVQLTMTVTGNCVDQGVGGLFACVLSLPIACATDADHPPDHPTATPVSVR